MGPSTSIADPQNSSDGAIAHFTISRRWLSVNLREGKRLTVNAAAVMRSDSLGLGFADAAV